MKAKTRLLRNTLAALLLPAVLALTQPASADISISFNSFGYNVGHHHYKPYHYKKHHHYRKHHQAYHPGRHYGYIKHRHHYSRYYNYPGHNYRKFRSPGFARYYYGYPYRFSEHYYPRYGYRY